MRVVTPSLRLLGGTRRFSVSSVVSSRAAHAFCILISRSRRKKLRLNSRYNLSHDTTLRYILTAFVHKDTLCVIITESSSLRDTRYTSRKPRKRATHRLLSAVSSVHFSQKNYNLHISRTPTTIRAFSFASLITGLDQHKFLSMYREEKSHVDCIRPYDYTFTATFFLPIPDILSICSWYV